LPSNPPMRGMRMLRQPSAYGWCGAIVMASGAKGCPGHRTTKSVALPSCLHCLRQRYSVAIGDAGASSAAVAINVRIGGPLASSSRAEPGAAWLLYGLRSLTKVAPHCMECGQGCLPVGVVRNADALQGFERHFPPAVVVALHAGEPSRQPLCGKGVAGGHYFRLAGLGAT